MPTPGGIDRRTFLAGALSAAAALAKAQVGLATFSDWLRADPSAREHGVAECLRRIRAIDGSIHAWVEVRPEKASGSGPLSGIPYAAKDIIETRGLATEFGSPVYKGRVGAFDAAIVKDLRARGAILLGKTHTAAFAYKDPPPTRNPRNLEHTPGGSSSGSAAAVAANMVPFALGTQTGGSILRPASYCGVTGFKPTHGTLPLDGVLEYSKSCDTLGLFTQTPADMLSLWEALGYSTGADEDLALAAPDPLPDIEPAMKTAFHDAIASLRRHGVSIGVVDLAPLLNALVEAQTTIATYEGARAHKERFREYGDRLGQVATLVRVGLDIPDDAYDRARRLVADSRDQLNVIYKKTPVIAVPAATGPAPLGLASTGDSRMNSPWTVVGTPAISIPLPVGGGLPLGLQLTAAPGADARVLRAAVRVHRILNR